MPFFVPQAVWDKLLADLAASHREYADAKVAHIETLAKWAEAKADAERWRGMYELATQQIANAQDREREAKAEAAQARKTLEDQDPWAVDPAEEARQRARMEQNPGETLLSADTGVRT